MSSPPTLYEYYTAGGISEGLTANQPFFTLNTKNITLYSGALHYFRVPPQYWRDRLRKMRSAGLNAVETYIPWNLHEPEAGTFDWGGGSTEYSEFLDVEKFLKIAQEEDLVTIVRPGPYICAEWEFGGLPSWLLRSNTKVRTSDPMFVSYVTRYFKALLTILSVLQFTKGGSIIAFQIENEYGNTKVDNEPIDTRYLEILKEILKENGVVELLFTSDTPSNGFFGTVPGVLATANFQDRPVYELALLKNYQPNKPLMVMEYWTGWFDHWTEKHHTRSTEAFGQVLEEILSFNSSVNMYMFHGGTNWGFLNGANIKGFETTDNSGYQPDTTSYDYDAPLSEAGDYTEKYFKVKELIQKHSTVVTKLPKQPDLVKRIAHPSTQVEEMLTLDDLIKQASYSVTSKKLLPMEMLDINNNSGQSYGYITYRLENLDIAPNSILKIEGHVCDTVLVLINGELQSKILSTQDDLNGFGYWRAKDATLSLGDKAYTKATLDLLVENWGRSNYGKLKQFNQHKGLWQGNVLINDTVLENWKIVPLEFKKSWTQSLTNWRPVGNTVGPVLYKSTLTIDEPVDTFIDMREWDKGVVIVNGFVLARYCKLGPQQTAYLPAPLLKKGSNTLLIFEHFRPSTSVIFSKNPVFKTLP
jgi:beta-galactosidase GanA